MDENEYKKWHASLTPEQRNQTQDIWLRMGVIQSKRRNRLNAFSTILLVICVLVFLLFLAEMWGFVVLPF